MSFFDLDRGVYENRTLELKTIQRATHIVELIAIWRPGLINERGT